ncbi:hypothetical protein ADIS_2626 [Lunatimonas lonarensis]|uniref:Neutral/alkaline non-lysosomal ceramidase N-terminal domain-containing protein n=1 Tax=Lunatimonas lonarensis TaxID=1232681 RepID=R7ZS81_9BACT|nr:hypothetical protein [Lunatimonas lonarensis]EON76965.1 hypothetical protein ADIS_2626 [Lunatimonas lonarensis]
MFTDTIHFRGFYYLIVIGVMLLASIPELSAQGEQSSPLRVGWASSDITPERPVLIVGQFYARVSEGVMDPLTATALALESSTAGQTTRVIWISCDLIAIGDGMRGQGSLREAVRQRVVQRLPEFTPEQIILNGTHTHAAPLVSTEMDVEELYGVSLHAMAPGVEAIPPAAYLAFAADRIADAAVAAWQARRPGGMSFGLSHAVVGVNRLQALKSGRSQMYGNTNSPDFSHIEGHEDHSLNLMFFWDEDRNLTGMIVNLAVPSQVSEHSYDLSADFWHETRAELRDRFGSDLYVLPQVSAAADQSPHIMIGQRAESRMQELLGFAPEQTGRGSMGHRRQIALRIADGVAAIFPLMLEVISWNPRLGHYMEELPLSRRLLSEVDVAEALQDAETWEQRFIQMKEDLNREPARMQNPRWYREITAAHTHLKRGRAVAERFEQEKKDPTLPIEVQALRIGDAVFATNPFELYLDYGMQMKARSAAVQTFVVQLAGSGTYLPTRRSIAGGAYGAIPASTLIGPEGGDELVAGTLRMIGSLFSEP